MPLAGAETVPPPGGLDPSRAAALGISSILTYAIFTVPAGERSDAFARLAEHAAAEELTVEYSETGLETLPAIWDDFAAGRAQTRIIVTPNQGTPS